MENPERNTVVLQSFRQMQSVKICVSSEPQQEQQQESEPKPESNQESAEPANSSPLQALIEFRVKQLHNRRFLLLKMQHLRRMSGDHSAGTSGGTAKEINCDESDESCELVAIQKELDELLHKKEELERRRKISNLTENGGRKAAHSNLYKSVIPRGGIYMLPPPQLTQEDVTLGQRVKTTPASETPTGPVVPVNHLRQTSAVTQCPSCNEVVFTQTQSKVGEGMWLLCCLCSMAGCVAGCCLIPFFVDRLRSVHHHCPQCQAHIHTFQPF